MFLVECITKGKIMKSVEILTGIGLMFYVGPSLCADPNGDMKSISNELAGLSLSLPVTMPISIPVVSPHRDEELQFVPGIHKDLKKLYQTTSTKIIRRKQDEQFVASTYKSEPLIFQKLPFEKESRKDDKNELSFLKNNDSSENETNVQLFPMNEDC